MVNRSGRRAGGRVVPLRVLLTAVAVLAAVMLAQLVGRAPAPTDRPSAVAEAFRAGRSNVWVETAGVVERSLPDDRAGSRHQRFVVRLEGGQTVLVSHNLDLAPRAHVAAGDSVAFRGEYEWNDLGGVVHWTHHDPDGHMPGGWIRAGGHTYR
jgi:hypothetical protein